MRIKLLLILTFTVKLACGQLNINNYITVGQTRLQVGNYVGAIENFNIVIKFKPQLPEPYFFRGMAKHQLEDFRGAIEDYNKALEIKYYYPQVYVNRGLAWLNLGEYEKAIADYDKALELLPHEPGIYNNRGIARMSMKDPDGAIEDYDKALENNPGFINAYINRSNAHIVKGDILEAIRDLNRSIIIRPRYANAYLLRGMARLQLNDYAAALRDFNQTLRFDPQNAYAFNNRGIVKQELEDYESAINDYTLALQLDPTLPNAYYNRGIAREMLNRPGAEQDFMIAAKLDPRLDMAKFRQAMEEEFYASVYGIPTGAQANNRQDENQSTGEETPDTDQQENSAEQRERRRFRLSLADSRNLPGIDQEEEVTDGRIQNRNVIIAIQDIFVIASFSKNSMDYEQLQYYNLTLEDLNRHNNYVPLMTITNRDTYDLAETFRENIQYFDSKLENDKSAINYLSRGIFRALTYEYNDAMADFNKSVELEGEDLLSRFSRANCKLRIAELIESVPDQTGESTITMDSGFDNSVTIQQRETLADYNTVVSDYDACVRINPAFPFSYFNRAYVLCKLGRYEEAIIDLDKAIERQPDFAEAFFNRGLINIYLDNIDEAALNLSKAGELGIEDAYNVIKRYCN